MSVSSAIKARRSIKYFDPDHEMPQSHVIQLIEHAMLTPSAFNLQHWRFVNIVEPSLRGKIKQLAWGQPQITDASLLLLVCMDVNAWSSEPEQCWHHVDAVVRNKMLQNIRGAYQDNPDFARDEAMRSCSLASMSIMLMAQELGYDSCAMDGFDFNAVASLVNLPSDHEICMMLAIGKQVKPPHNRGGLLNISNILFENRF